MTGPWPMQVFYDGACPLCGAEVRYYRARDVHQRIEWIDIAAAKFDAAKYGLAIEKLQNVMHAKATDGRVFTQVAAFVKIWEALPATFWTRLARWVLKVPGMMQLAGVFYRTFARNRYWLTGRCEGGMCGATPSGGISEVRKKS